MSVKPVAVDAIPKVLRRSRRRAGVSNGAARARAPQGMVEDLDVVIVGREPDVPEFADFERALHVGRARGWRVLRADQREEWSQAGADRAEVAQGARATVVVAFLDHLEPAPVTEHPTLQDVRAALATLAPEMVSDIVIVGGHAGVAGPMQFSARGERVHHVASLHRLQPFFERVVTLARSEAAAFHRDAVGDSGPDLEPTNPDAAAEWFDGWMRRVRAWDASGSLGREHGWGMHGSQRVNLFESGALSHFNALAESVLTDPGLQWLARHAVTDLEPLPIQAATGLVLATGFADEMAADDLIALSPYGRACCAATQQVDATGEFWRAFEAASVSELRWCEQFANHDAVLFEGVAQAVCPSYVAPTRNASKSIGTRISELRSEELLDLVRARRAVVARVQPPVSAAEPIRVASKARGREAHLLDIMRTRTSAGLDGRMGLGH